MRLKSVIFSAIITAAIVLAAVSSPSRTVGGKAMQVAAIIISIVALLVTFSTTRSIRRKVEWAVAVKKHANSGWEQVASGVSTKSEARSIRNHYRPLVAAVRISSVVREWRPLH